MFDDLLRYNSAQKYCIFDFETEGLNLLFSRPFQLAFIVCDFNKIIETHNYHIWWPDINVSKGAAIQTRFNYNKYKEIAINPQEVISTFDKYLFDNSIIKVGHKILTYDCIIYKNWRALMRLEPNDSFLPYIIDTDCIAKAIEKKIIPDKSNLLQWQFKMSNLVEKGLKSNLTSQGKKYKIEYDYTTLHDGMNDVELNRQVFFNQIWNIEI